MQGLLHSQILELTGNRAEFNPFKILRNIKAGI